MSTRHSFCVILSVSILLGLFSSAAAQPGPVMSSQEGDEMKEWNHRIRREKFDLVLPEVMRAHHVDMWIHVMREAISDPFGAEDLGSTSGVFVFTDRGGDRIERAVLGRRWGASHRGQVDWETKLVEECGAYDIIFDPVRVQQLPASPMTEYDYRFKGLREFVVSRNPKCIAVNYMHDLGPYVTFRGSQGNRRDGLSHTDYVLLTEVLGDKYANRLVSSEYVMMDYTTRPVPTEIKLLKKMRKDEAEYVKKVFSEIKPGVTKTRELGETGDEEVDVVVFRRMSTGESQRGRSKSWENSVAQGGDIVAAPSQGMYAYVLREGETEPPQEIKKLWAEYLKIDKILAHTIKAGLTAHEIIQIYKRKFADEGIIVRDDELHMVRPKNNFPVFSEGFDPEKTQLSLCCHGMVKGARKRKTENYLAPNVGTFGNSTWAWDIPLPTNHHFVLEYFFYMPSPTSNKDEDQYLLFWDHEQAIATEKGVEYLSPPQKELYLIK
ncbi:MAG: hypothetical protein JRI52_03735 [Deltaproteobacteria bacterium]|nr:hypothetical protein [Deltaproteobacteria bacterium]